MSLLSPSLEAFWAVVQKTTVQDASKILGLTQTGVTQRIRSLEKQLGVTLFLRSRKGMKLTHEGESLLHYVKVCRDQEGMTLAQLKSAARDHNIEISIAGPSSILRSRVIPNLLSVMKTHQNLRFKFQITDSENILELLKTGACEIGILEQSLVVNELDFKALKAEKYLLVGADKFKKKDIKYLVQNEPIVDFDSNDKMTLRFLEKYKLLGPTRSARHYVNNPDALSKMVSEGIGYSVIPEAFLNLHNENKSQKRLSNLLPGKFLDCQFAAAWYPRHQIADYFKTVLNCLK